MSDYYEQAMKEIVRAVLVEQIDFSIYPTGGPTADDVAGKVAAKLRANEFVQATGIGGPMEKQVAAQ